VLLGKDTPNKDQCGNAIKNHSSTHTAAVIAGTIAAVAVVAIIATGAFFLWRRKHTFHQRLTSYSSPAKIKNFPKLQRQKKKEI